MQRIPMTVRGESLLRKELEMRKGTLRNDITKAIAEARAHGDLKENAEYHAAREQQSFNEGRIQDIESKLSLAQVIDTATLPRNGTVVFGTTVTIQKSSDETTNTYTIVGEDEADIETMRISYNSPIARALIGKEVNDEAIVETPQGKVEYVILDITYE